MGIFYLPKDGVCGDFIPYYNEERGRIEIYYLHDYRGRDGHGEGTDWRRISTTDCANFKEEGECIVRGTPVEQDLFCYTGCVLIHDGLQHIFYTGHNYHLMQNGGRKEAVMHATSTDGVHWAKRHELTFFAPDIDTIEHNDWRDPFVFYNEEEGCWWMLLCTRKKTGPDRMRGATGLLKSADLDRWEYCGSFWDPSNCWCPECPDLFKWGKYWYFVYSTFNEAEGLRTYYRMAETLEGPWIAPKNNTFDGRAFYAGKTAFDGDHRFIFGWNPTRTGDVDAGVWQWGGCLVTHELWQTENGELRVKMPQAMNDLFGSCATPRFQPVLQTMQQDGDTLTICAKSGFGLASGGKIPERCMIRLEVYMEHGTRDAGIVLHSDEAGDEGYYLRLEAMHDRFVFDRTHRICEHIDIERNADVSSGSWHKLEILLDGTAMTAYLDDTYALSARMYDYSGSDIMFFVSDGTTHFRNVCVLEAKEEEVV